MTTPNEPNKARTIPLHIADQAVAACEAEIQKLKEENARLNYQVSRLMLQVNSPHPAVMRWSLACKERDALKAEVERLRKAGDELLDGWIGMYGDHEGSRAEGYIKAWNAAKEGKSV